MPGAHSPLSPSKSARYLACPGSVAAESALPDTTGIEAARGSCFHQYAELCLELGFDPDVFVGSTYTDKTHGVIEFDHAMAGNMLPGLDFIESRSHSAEMYVEQRVPLAEWLGAGEFGTSDVGLIEDRGRITVFDWKYGMVPVDPRENTQALLYALGFWALHGRRAFGRPKGIELDLVIEQPRAPGGGGIWSLTMADALARGEDIARKAKRTKDPKAPRVPGAKQCQFCKAARHRTCEEYLDWILEPFDSDRWTDFEELGLEPPMPQGLSIERRVYLLRHQPAFERFMKQLHADTFAELKQGFAVPGLKLVRGRAGARSWADPDKSEKRLFRELGEDAYTRKLVSPAAVEALLGRQRAARFVKGQTRQGNGKLVMVAESDPRNAVQAAEDLFDEIEESESGEDEYE